MDAQVSRGWRTSRRPRRAGYWSPNHRRVFALTVGEYLEALDPGVCGLARSQTKHAVWARRALRSPSVPSHLGRNPRVGRSRLRPMFRRRTRFCAADRGPGDCFVGRRPGSPRPLIGRLWRRLGWSESLTPTPSPRTNGIVLLKLQLPNPSRVDRNVSGLVGEPAAA
jgi:hypothetical protein